MTIKLQAREVEKLFEDTFRLRARDIENVFDIDIDFSKFVEKLNVALAKKMEGHVLAPMEPTQEMLDAASPPAPQWRSTKASIAVREWANAERREEYMNITKYLKEQQQ